MPSTTSNGKPETMYPVANAETACSAYHSLYRLGGAAAWFAAGMIGGEVIALALYPPPSTIEGWFMLFQRNRLVGLLDFWGLEVPLYLLFALVFLALYAALRRADPSRMAVALTSALLGIGVFLATNQPFAMLSLGNQYAAATTGAQRATLLAAGQALLAATGQRAVGGFNLGLCLVSLAGLLVSSVMAQSRHFGKPIAYVGLVAHALSLADFLRQALTPSALVALAVILPNALLLMIWYGWAGHKLRRLGRLAETLPSQARSNRPRAKRARADKITRGDDNRGDDNRGDNYVRFGSGRIRNPVRLHTRCRRDRGGDAARARASRRGAASARGAFSSRLPRGRGGSAALSLPLAQRRAPFFGAPPGRSRAATCGGVCARPGA